MEIKDLAGVSGPVEKLVQVVADGIGAIAYPWIVRREARAIADAQKILADGGLAFESATMKSLPAQIASRITYQEAKRQNNLLKIVDEARKALPENVSQEPVDPDWGNRFFAGAQEISNEQMQQLWGRLLAGEVARPGSVSPRTLDHLRNMTSSDAKLFSKLCEFAFESDTGEVFVLDVQHGRVPAAGGELGEVPIYAFQCPGLPKLMSAYAAQGLSESSLRLLAELDLIGAVPGDAIVFRREGKSAFEFAIQSGSRALRVTCERQEGYGYLTLPVVRLTRVGRELFRLHRPGVAPDFDAAIVELFHDVGFRASWQPIPSRSGPAV
ncbi:DUF2806 domain-containing protein [Vitiosangium sp. GDMCC 1.1324]|uniref:DUF2806 domain-containing protein n=1 Tax=Vitiosangium sp. (strain GDMCC 1.1324) TaxID=2138576 RepID=UPI000D340199|nr:DUF2806 domain-containing protein [Vitiosangium sp. GDMCC 1.1324]PTL75526.1 hypothetical protein DAT35_54715 [Vitiosangium sp. GDMCC 1.1324]